MADINKYFPKLMGHEGGYVFNTLDRGGPTNKGVTLKKYQEFYGSNKTIEDLKKITDAEVKAILKKDFWDKIKADLIQSQSVAEICVDWVYNSGTGKIKNIQKILGVEPDGVFGNVSLAKLNSFDPEWLFYKIQAARVEFYNKIISKDHTQKVFEKGWMNRINSFKFNK